MCTGVDSPSHSFFHPWMKSCHSWKGISLTDTLLSRPSECSAFSHLKTRVWLMDRPPSYFLAPFSMVLYLTYLLRLFELFLRLWLESTLDCYRSNMHFPAAAMFINFGNKTKQIFVYKVVVEHSVAQRTLACLHLRFSLPLHFYRCGHFWRSSKISKGRNDSGPVWAQGGREMVCTTSMHTF